MDLNSLNYFTLGYAEVGGSESIATVRHDGNWNDVVITRIWHYDNLLDRERLKPILNQFARFENKEYLHDVAVTQNLERYLLKNYCCEGRDGEYLFNSSVPGIESGIGVRFNLDFAFVPVDESILHRTKGLLQSGIIGATKSVSEMLNLKSDRLDWSDSRFVAVALALSFLGGTPPMDIVQLDVFEMLEL